MAPLGDVPPFGRAEIDRWPPSIPGKFLTYAASEHIATVLTVYQSAEDVDILPVYGIVGSRLGPGISVQTGYDFVLPLFGEQGRMMVLNHDELLFFVW